MTFPEMPKPLDVLGEIVMRVLQRMRSGLPSLQMPGISENPLPHNAKLPGWQPGIRTPWKRELGKVHGRAGVRRVTQWDVPLPASPLLTGCSISISVCLSVCIPPTPIQPE